VWKGATDVAAGFLADRYLTLPKGKADSCRHLTLKRRSRWSRRRARAARRLVKVALEGKPMAEFR
jgi:hypothetical protein